MPRKSSKTRNAGADPLSATKSRRTRPALTVDQKRPPLARVLTRAPLLDKRPPRIPGRLGGR